MVDIDLVRKAGGSQEKLKSLFSEGKKSGKNDPKLKDVYNRIRDHINTGVTYNLKHYKLYYALDLAWNTPLRQTSHTLLNSLVDRKLDDESVQSAVKDFGLSHLIVKGEDGKKTLNVPVFTDVLIPLVRAYLTIRWSRILNDRKAYPFLKFDPLHLTMENKIKSDIVSDRVQMISQQYDYQSVLRQCVFQMLHYGYCLAFPMESWHEEKQEKDGLKEPVVVREGLRYHMPHPTRTYWDFGHRLSTINSDSGCSYMGYWTIKKWRDIDGNPDWWNKEKVSKGTTDWMGTHTGFFSTVGEACAMAKGIPTQSSRVGQLDRESEVGFYTDQEADMGVLYTESFEKLNPKKYNLFDYDHEIWMRFVVASDDTILFAEPLPYTPAVAYIYDSNENQYMNSSLSLEIMPSQDMVGNLLSQYILSVKQNLSNLNLLDSDAFADFDEAKRNGLMDKLRNYGEKWYRSLNFEWFSGRKNKFAQGDISRAVQSFKFTPLPTEGLLSGLRTILDLLERSLVMSSQEVAAAASHEQTAEEIKVIDDSKSTRLEFTATAVDQAMYAWKKQLYGALMAFGEPEFYAQIPTKVSKEKLEKMGFTVEEEWNESSRHMLVKSKNKTAIAMESFASTRDQGDRINTQAVATAMTQVLSVFLGNERLLNSIGDDQALELINLINRYMGLPEDFQLRKLPGTMPPQEQLMQIAQAIQQDTLGKVQAMVEPVAQQVIGIGQNLQAVAAQTQANAEQIATVADITQRLSQILQIAASSQLPATPSPYGGGQEGPVVIPPAPPGAGMAPEPVMPVG